MAGKIDPLFANHPEILAQQEQTRAFVEGLKAAAKGFDIECYKLAAHFLSDEPMNDTVDAERYRNALACHIQAEIESWILYERLGFDERGGSPNQMPRAEGK